MSKASALAVVTPTVTREQVDLVRRTIFPDATDPELQLFLHDCARRGVHPLDRLVYPTKRGGRYTTITSIDFMRSQAAGTGEMAGSDDATFRLDPDDLSMVSASVTVYRLTQGQRFAYTATARWEEYCPDPGPSGKGDLMWRRMPHTMLGKCAEALALRKAFPQQLGGLYAAEELHQAERPEPPPATPVVEADSVSKSWPPMPGPTPPPPGPPPGPPPVPPAAAADIGPRTGKPASSAWPPAGFYVIDQFEHDGKWFHVYLGSPPQHYKTQIVKIGALLRDAYTRRVPVALDVAANKKPGEAGYVNRVRYVNDGDELEAREATRIEDDNPPA